MALHVWSFVLGVLAIVAFQKAHYIFTPEIGA